MAILPEIVKILSEDSHLIKNRLKFVHSLGISEAKVASWVKLHDMGHCQPYDLVHGILSEWIATRDDFATIAELRRILRGIDFNLCSNNLSHLEKMHPGPIGSKGLKTSSGIEAIASPHSSRLLTKTSIVFGVKDFVLNFMGRDEELATLNEYFHSRNCRSVLLSGLGGIGKTELAKKFLFSLSDPSGSHQIFKSWLAGESPQSLLNSTTQFCHYLHLSATGSDGQPLGMQEMLKNIFTKIKSTGELSRWLLVIDNVDEIHQEFEAALETLLDFGSFVFLLVTSRRRDIYAGKLMQVTELKLQDGVKLVSNSLKTDESSKAAILALCHQLDNFPLALSQAVAYIEQQQRQTLTGEAYGVQNYLNELANKETLGLDQDLRFTEYPKATLKVWHLTLDRIAENHGAKGRMALNLLNVMAFIIPDNIQISSLNKLYKRFYTTEEIDFYQDQIHSWLTILLQYSLISSCNSLINIHRLVQLALRERMASKSNQDNQIIDVEMLKSFWTSFDHNEWKRDEMANILQIWKHSCSHPELQEQLATKSYFLSIQLDHLVMFNESYNFATECCKFLLDIYGPENKQYLLMEQELAIAMKRKGLYESSLQKFTFVHKKLTELCGEEDRDTLNTGHWIAAVLFDLKRYEESLEWGQKVLLSRIRIHGEKNASTMSIKTNMALALQNLGKGEEALKMHNEILEWQQVHLGKHHLSTLTTRENIGVCFYEVEKYAEALDNFQNVFSLRQQHLGVDHPYTLTTKSWLADTLEKMGEIDKALKIWEEVAIAREKILSSDHPETVFARKRVTLFKNKQNQ